MECAREGRNQIASPFREWFWFRRGTPRRRYFASKCVNSCSPAQRISSICRANTNALTLSASNLRCFGMLPFELLDPRIECGQLLAKVLDLGAVLDGPTRLPSPLCWHDDAFPT